MQKEKDFMLFGLEPHQSTYRGIWLFFGVYFGSTLFAAILTPPVYFAFHYFWPDMPEWLARKRVDIFFDRIRYIPIVLCLPVIFQKCGLLHVPQNFFANLKAAFRGGFKSFFCFLWKYICESVSVSLSNVGLDFSKNAVTLFGKYLLSGIFVASAIFAMQVAFANVSFAPMSTNEIVPLLKTIIFSWILGALLIGILEELLFRALIFRCFYTAMSCIFSILLTSAFFAYKHFHVPSSIWDNIPGNGKIAEWHTGFIVAWYDTVGVFMNWNTVLFLAIFFFGLVLSLTYIRTKILWGPAGFHSGIVLTMFIYKANVKLDFTPEQVFLFGGTNPSGGLVSVIILCLMTAFLGYKIVKAKKML